MYLKMVISVKLLSVNICVLLFLKLSFSLTRVSLNHSLMDNVTNSSFVHCLWIGLDVLYCFVTYNLISKPFMMVRGVKKLSFCVPVDLGYLY